MLDELVIKNFAIIDHLELAFQPGLNIVTGETGAGKSVILEAVNLLVGGRVDGSRVRREKEAADICGRFILDDGTERVLRRLVVGEGKSRAYVNGEMVVAGKLSEVGETLLDIHGQHEHQSLLKAANHLDLIDRYDGRIEAVKSTYRARLVDHNNQKKALDALTAAEGDRSRRQQLLEWQIQELGQANLVIGEDESLEKEIKRLKNHARLSAAVTAAKAALDNGAVDGCQSAYQELSRAADADPDLKTAVDLLAGVCADIEETTALLRDYGASQDFDQSHLEAVEERLFFLSDLKRKYETSNDGLLERLEASRKELEQLDDSRSAAGRAEQAAGEALRELEDTAAELSAMRADAGRRFAAEVREQLKDLGMVNASLAVKCVFIDEGKFGPFGRDKLELLFSANAGEPPRPLAKVASGGELSRVMLAIRTVFGLADTVPTLVFDEIDAGIGGRTAVNIGARLSALGRDRQVICVTHLAQIAAFADHHLVVAKDEAGGRTAMAVRVVEGAEKLGELSRLAGALEESSATLDHARLLLEQAMTKKTAGAAHE